MTQQRREQVNMWAGLFAVVVAVVGPVGAVVYTSGRSDQRAEIIEARVANIEVRAREDHDLLVDMSADVRWIKRALEDRK